MMFHAASKLLKYTVQARDGSIGSVKDLFFDDAQWTIRYFVVDAGSLLKSRQVLLAPEAVNRAQWDTAADETRLVVDLTQEQVTSSPPVDAAKPVSRQQEEQLRRYYGWPAYWMAPAYMGSGYPGTGAPMFPAPAVTVPEPPAEEPTGDPHLRSCREVKGYRIALQDGDLGHVEDFLIGDRQWDVAYLVVDTRNWLPGRKVIVSPLWVQGISWSDGQVTIDLDRETLRSAPPFDSSRPLTAEYVQQLHTHLARPPYSGW